MTYDKKEHRVVDEPHKLWAHFLVRTIIGEGFYVLSTNNLSKEDK